MIDSDKRASLRSMLQIGLGVIATGAIVSEAKAQDDKIAQNLVQYQTTPKDGAHCEACVNWVAPNACKIVAGTIAPTGWCVAFAPKEG